MEDYKHCWLLPVVHQTVEAVSGVCTSGRGSSHGGTTQCVTAGDNTSNIQSLHSRLVWWRKPLCRVFSMDGKVNSSSVCGSCRKNDNKKIWNNLETLLSCLSGTGFLLEVC